MKYVATWMEQGKDFKMRRLNQIIMVVLFFCLVAIFLVSCDPAGEHYQSIDRVFVSDGLAYLRASDKCSMGLGCGVTGEEFYYYTSQDDGKTWEKIDMLPFELLPDTEEWKQCISNSPDLCYRITEKEQVEITRDGEKTWQVDWIIPLGRKKFVERDPQIPNIWDVSPDTVPLDLGIINRDDVHVVIVAMGNQGVLVKSSTGDWEQYAVSRNTEDLTFPLPYSATSIREAIPYIISEVLWCVFATFFFTIFQFIRWRVFCRPIIKKGGYKRKLKWGMVSFIMSQIVLVVWLAVTVAPFILKNDNFNMFDSNNFVLFLDFLLGCFCLLPFIILILAGMYYVGIIQKQEIYYNNSSWMALAYVAASFSGLVLPLFLWAFGFIPIYEIAVMLSIVLSVLIAYITFRNQKSLAKFTSNAEENEL